MGQLPEFFRLSPDPDTDPPMDEEESPEDTLCDHAGQPIDWTGAGLYRVGKDTVIPDTYLRAVECTQTRVAAHGLAWVCHPKHVDADVRTDTIPCDLLE